MENINKVKLAKFEIMLEETIKWLCPDPFYIFCYQICPSMPFYLPIEEEKLNKYMEDPYFKKIYDVCFSLPKNKSITGPSIKDLTNEIRELKNADEYECLGLFDIGLKKISYFGYGIRGCMIFIGLLLCSINDDFYNNEKGMVSDLACIFGFTEDMMADWIAGVKYFLEGNKIGKDMKIEFKTKEANKFFKWIK